MTCGRVPGLARFLGRLNCKRCPPERSAVPRGTRRRHVPLGRADQRTQRRRRRRRVRRPLIYFLLLSFLLTRFRTRSFLFFASTARQWFFLVYAVFIDFHQSLPNEALLLVKYRVSTGVRFYLVILFAHQPFGFQSNVHLL